MLPVGRPFRPYTMCPDDAGRLIEDVWPPILFGAERLDEIRRKLERYGWAAEMFATMRDEADDIVAREAPEQPVEPVGWRHEFFAPETGEPLAYEPDQPEAFWVPSLGRRVAGTEAQHRAWVLLTHERTHRLMRSLALLYRLTGDERYALWVADGLRRAAEMFAHDELRDGNRHRALYFQPLYDSAALAHLAVAYDLIRRSSALAPADHEPIVDGVFGRGVPHLLRFLDQIGVHNMACWAAMAAATCGNVVARTDWISAGLDGDGGLASLLLRGVDADGLWYEGSTFYHWYSFCPLAGLFELARALHDPVVEDPEVADRLTNMLRAPLALVDSQDRLPVLGDLGDPRVLCLDAYRHAYEYGAGRLLPIEFGPTAARLADRCGGRDGWTALAYGLGELPEAARRPGRSTALPAAGIGVFRGRGPRMWAMLRAGAHGGGHDHRDKLHLSIHACGEPLAPDLGSSGYALREPQAYYRGTLAHNTLLVDEADQAEVTDGELIWMPPYAEGLVRDAYPGVLLRRRVWFEPPWLALEDHCDSDQAHRYGWVFGALGPLRLTIDGAGGVSGLPAWPNSGPFAWLAGLERTLAAGVVEARWRCGERLHLRLLVTSDGPFEVTSVSLPGNPFGAARRAVVLRAEGARRRFRALFEVHHGRPLIERWAPGLSDDFAWRGDEPIERLRTLVGAAP